MEGYVKGAVPRAGLRPPWLPFLGLQVCEWVSEGTGHRRPLRDGAVGLSQCYPLLHIPDILPTRHPARRLCTAFIHMVTHTGLKTGPTLAVWPGQGLLLSQPHSPHLEARQVTTPPPLDSMCKGLRMVHGLQCALRK